MSAGVGTQVELERLKNGVAHALKDEEAAEWVVTGQAGMVGTLKSRISKPCIALISFDVDKIKDFVFGSVKPLEVQGASAMVKELETDGALLGDLLKEFGLPSDAVVFAGGGNGLLVVPAQSAQAFAARLREKFTEKTGLGTCSVAWRAFAPHELIAGPEGSLSDRAQLPSGVELLPTSPANGEFGSVLRLLADQLREAKEEAHEPLLPPLPGYLHRCESCGLEAASCVDQVRPQEAQDRICQHCLDKRNRGREERHRLEAQGLETALSINEVVGEEEGGYFAVIYADANDMGSVLFKLPTMIDCALFSRAVSAGMREIVDEIVRSHKLQERYQSPVLGGDDLLLIVPAKRAVSIVDDLLAQVPATFKRRASEVGGEAGKKLSEVTVCIGFVIVPAHFAIRFAFDYAEELLRLAKENRRELIKSNPPKEAVSVDYLVVKDASPLNLSVRALRRQHLERNGLRLTAKPLSLSHFKRLLEDARRLREVGVPRSQLQQLEDLLWSDSLQGIKLNLRYQLVRSESWKRFFELRMGSSGAFDFAAAIEDWMRAGAFHVATRAGGRIHHTDLLDLLELYEFLE